MAITACIMSKKISMTKLITADFYRRNAETIINSRKSINSRGVHSHPPPPPNRVSVALRARLQELIHQANDNTTDVTPTSIITGNL